MSSQRADKRPPPPKTSQSEPMQIQRQKMHQRRKGQRETKCRQPKARGGDLGCDDSAKLQGEISFGRFLAVLPRLVLRSRMGFSSFLARSFRISSRTGSCLSTAAYPIPVSAFPWAFRKAKDPQAQPEALTEDTHASELFACGAQISP